MKLTKPQREELKRLLREPRNTFGASTVRVQNTLVRLGLAEYRWMSMNAYSSEYCCITQAGKDALGN